MDGDDFYREQLDMTRSEQEKNMSFKAQVCAWVMAGAVVVLVLVVVLFVGVLLAGNQWAAEGVGSSSNAAQQILPKVGVALQYRLVCVCVCVHACACVCVCVCACACACVYVYALRECCVCEACGRWL